ncbi:MAG: class I SAM-dependent methyltransferase [Defluviitaleaceae bacterium]|nr:class I SAM-dependent methyltransferase [Defluviitaleaceae bacterium]
MDNKISEKLAGSLTAETTELIPFLPYLLQDFWEIGSEPNIMIELLQQYATLPKDSKVLDLACGKGAVSVKMAHQLKLQIKGVDIIPDFVKFAVQKAEEYSVSHLCEFVIGGY